MGNIRRGRHDVYTLNYHIVWIPRYRKKVWVGAVAKRLHELLFAIASQHEFEILHRIDWGNSPLWAKSYSIGSAGHVSSETIKYSIEACHKL